MTRRSSVGIDDGQRLGLGTIEGEHRFLDRHARQQNACRGYRRIALIELSGGIFGGVRVRHQHHADIAALFVHSNNRGR